MQRRIVLATIAASLLVTRAVPGAFDVPLPDSNQTTICHVSPWNPAKKKTLTVPNPFVRFHLTAHPGDIAGPCSSAICGNGLCEGPLGETPATCAQDCLCDCQASANATGLAVDLGTVLGTGTATLVAGVCASCDAAATSIAFSFTPSIEGTPFTFTATAVGAPICNLIPDPVATLGTTVVSGQGAIATSAAQQSTNFTLTLVEVAGQVCTAILNLDSASVLGLPSGLTVPLSLPCGDLTLATCQAP